MDTFTLFVAIGNLVMLATLYQLYANKCKENAVLKDAIETQAQMIDELMMQVTA